MAQFEQNLWPMDDMKRVEGVMSMLPQRHIRYNSWVREVSREDVLHHAGTNYPMVTGVYRPGKNSMVLYDSAFTEVLNLGETEAPALEFTFLTLVGYSLLHTSVVKKHWVDIFYPRFGKAKNERAHIQLVDQEKLLREVRLHNKSLILDEESVSAEKSFAVCYAAYVLFPEYLLRSFPEAYHFLREQVFVGKEYQRSGGERAGRVMRV